MDKNKKEENSELDKLTDDAPPIMKTWKNIYIFVLGNLLFWIILFSIFTSIYK